MELKQIWEEALKIIEQEAPSAVSFETWILPVVPCGIDGNQFILQAESDIYKETIEKRYLPIIRNAIKFIAKKEYEIVILTEEEQKKTACVRSTLPQKRRKRTPTVT